MTNRSMVSLVVDFVFSFFLSQYYFTVVFIKFSTQLLKKYFLYFIYIAHIFNKSSLEIKTSYILKRQRILLTTEMGIRIHTKMKNSC